MLKHEAVKLSPFGYATRSSERGTLYATNGGLYLEIGGALRPITLPPDKIDTWEPVLPEVERREPMSDQASAQAGPDRWADRADLPSDKIVVHRDKRKPAVVTEAVPN